MEERLPSRFREVLSDKQATLFAVLWIFVLFPLCVYIVNQSLFFIPKAWGWINQDSDTGATSYQSLRGAISLILGMLLSVYSLYLYFRHREALAQGEEPCTPGPVSSYSYLQFMPPMSWVFAALKPTGPPGEPLTSTQVPARIPTSCFKCGKSDLKRVPELYAQVRLRKKLPLPVEELRERLEPPQKPEEYWGVGCGTVVFIPFLAAFLLWPTMIWLEKRFYLDLRANAGLLLFVWIGLIMLLHGTHAYSLAARNAWLRYKQKELWAAHQMSLSEWKRKWCCLNCGELFS